MKSASVRNYGPPEVVEIVEVPMPQPKPGEVLVRVESVAVTAGDHRLRSGQFPRGFGPIAKIGVGFKGPRKRVLGMAFAGVVERIGEGVSDFAVGDAIAGLNGKTAAMHAEYANVPVNRAVHLVPGVTADEAASVVFGGTAALYFLRDKVRLQPGQTVLVNGASGSVGSAAVQLARHCGAHVTAITSGRNVELVRGLGAHEVVDYERTPIDNCLGQFDVVFDAVGTIGRKQGLKLAGATGRVVLIAADLAETVRGGRRVITGVAPEKPADFLTLMQLVADGALDPMVTNVGSLEDIVEAHRIASSGRKVGNVVVRPAG